jgi:hypothetical protein
MPTPRLMARLLFVEPGVAIVVVVAAEEEVVVGVNDDVVVGSVGVELVLLASAAVMLK